MAIRKSKAAKGASKSRPSVSQKRKAKPTQGAASRSAQATQPEAASSPKAIVGEAEATRQTAAAAEARAGMPDGARGAQGGAPSQGSPLDAIAQAKAALDEAAQAPLPKAPQPGEAVVAETSGDEVETVQTGGTYRYSPSAYAELAAASESDGADEGEGEGPSGAGKRAARRRGARGGAEARAADGRSGAAGATDGGAQPDGTGAAVRAHRVRGHVRGRAEGAAAGDASAEGQAASQGAAASPRKKAGFAAHGRGWWAARVAATVVIAAIMVGAGVFCAERWGGDDAADLQGAWQVVGSEARIVIDGESIHLTDDVAYAYTLDAQDKTLSFTLGNMSGQGRYWFSPDRSQLVIEDGSFSGFDTFFTDVGRALECLAASVQGRTFQVEAGDGVAVLERASAQEGAGESGAGSEQAVDASAQAESEDGGAAQGEGAQGADALAGE